VSEVEIVRVAVVAAAADGTVIMLYEVIMNRIVEVDEMVQEGVEVAEEAQVATTTTTTAAAVAAGRW